MLVTSVIRNRRPLPKSACVNRQQAAGFIPPVWSHGGHECAPLAEVELLPDCAAAI